MLQEMMKNMDTSQMVQMCHNMRKHMDKSEMMQKMPDNERIKEMCKKMENAGFKPQKFCKDYINSSHKHEY